MTIRLTVGRPMSPPLLAVTPPIATGAARPRMARAGTCRPKNRRVGDGSPEHCGSGELTARRRPTTRAS